MSKNSYSNVEFPHHSSILTAKNSTPKELLRVDVSSIGYTEIYADGEEKHFNPAPGATKITIKNLKLGWNFNFQSNQKEQFISGTLLGGIRSIGTKASYDLLDTCPVVVYAHDNEPEIEYGEIHNDNNELLAHKIQIKLRPEAIAQIAHELRDSGLTLPVETLCIDVAQDFFYDSGLIKRTRYWKDCNENTSLGRIEKLSFLMGRRPETIVEAKVANFEKISEPLWSAFQQIKEINEKLSNFKVTAHSENLIGKLFISITLAQLIAHWIISSRS